MINFINKLLGNLLGMPRYAKKLLVISLDTSFCILSVWISYYLRLGESLSLSAMISLPVIIVSAISIILAIPVFLMSGLYMAIFRYNGMPAMMTLTRATLIYGFLFSAVITILGMQGVPRTVGLIQPIIIFLFLGASRATARVWLGDQYRLKVKKSSLPQVLIYGAGSTGRQLANSLSNSREMQVVGFLDDDERLHGHILNGLQIFNPEDLEEIAQQKNISCVLLAVPTA